VVTPPPPNFERRPPRAEDDLAVFERQLVRFYTEGKIGDEVYDQLIARVRAERAPKPATDVTPPAEKVVVEKVVVQSASSVVVERKVEPPARTATPPPPP